MARDYLEPHLRLSLVFFICALFIYPACLLGFIRKAIAKRDGDWNIVVFVLATNFVLFWLLSREGLR